MGRGFREQQNQGVASKPGGLPATHSVSPINQDKNSSVTGGISFQGAQDYGKVINLALLHPPPPPTFSSLHRDDCQLCLCPCSTAFCSALCCCKWNTEEGGILIRWLATVSLRHSTYCVCLCVRACVCTFSVGRSGFLGSWNRTWFYIKVWINLDYHLMNIRASNCILLRIRGGY